MDARNARRVLSRHALDRYHRRIDKTIGFLDVEALLRDGRFTTSMPASLPDTAEVGVGYVVTGAAVFPVRWADDTETYLIATTTLKRRRYSKADRRAHRRDRREAWSTA